MLSIQHYLKIMPAPFEFTVEEQEFYNEKGFSQPKRCADCRSKNRQRKNERKGGGSREQVRYEVTCSACGVETTTRIAEGSGSDRIRVIDLNQIQLHGQPCVTRQQHVNPLPAAPPCLWSDCRQSVGVRDRLPPRGQLLR